MIDGLMFATCAIFFLLFSLVGVVIYFPHLIQMIIAFAIGIGVFFVCGILFLCTFLNTLLLNSRYVSLMPLRMSKSTLGVLTVQAQIILYSFIVFFAITLIGYIFYHIKIRNSDRGIEIKYFSNDVELLMQKFSDNYFKVFDKGNPN